MIVDLNAGNGGAELSWRRSSYSGSGGGDCVEIAIAPGTVHVRDSKAQAGAMLAFPREQWAAFTSYAGEITA
ncbi:DUF397 domain-containing protein [Streptomyces sp. NEAU-W12]|uniref:DUF397 domain-containing protein n=1 Tax=Streptomyces sp. NEAU-W12 TaxID=2994668 RepID=UPI00224A8495|nr:DUF397 domain-containing protein [Streptomyces sp. NEAU-W12]MCX2926128.1 DUF397 domain-containing protein [Streptomyces sp. NEAU-W12]